MDITPLVPVERQVIEGYGGGGFTVSGARHEGSLLVTPDRVLGWPVDSPEAITAESLEPILSAETLDILLIGCGQKGVFLPASLRNAVRERGPVVDAMDTGAACRTYNVLMAEERRVAAALIAVA